jgi:branched-chain amino acid transport system ATP-binding protein
MLEVKGLGAGYGDIVAVRDFSFSVEAGKVLALLGANGAGKSSTLMALMGMVEQKAGEILLDGVDISKLAADRRITRGMAIVPEGRRIFPDLTVQENLTVGGHVSDASTLAAGTTRAYEYFPRLMERKEQKAGSLSGGEQQMLALGRALVSAPRLLLVDELSLGLMPRIIDECYEVLARLRGDGLAIVLVEQNTERALAVADNVAVLEAGNSVWSGTAKEAAKDSAIAEAYLGTA